MNRGTGVGFDDEDFDPVTSLEGIPVSERTWRESQMLKSALLAREALVRIHAAEVHAPLKEQWSDSKYRCIAYLSIVPHSSDCAADT